MVVIGAGVIGLELGSVYKPSGRGGYSDRISSRKSRRVWTPTVQKTFLSVSLKKQGLEAL